MWVNNISIPSILWGIRLNGWNYPSQPWRKVLSSKHSGPQRGAVKSPKNFRCLKWRDSEPSGYFGGWMFPSISHIHTACVGEHSSIWGTWNVWWNIPLWMAGFCFLKVWPTTYWPPVFFFGQSDPTNLCVLRDILQPNSSTTFGWLDYLPKSPCY